MFEYTRADKNKSLTDRIQENVVIKISTHFFGFQGERALTKEKLMHFLIMCGASGYPFNMYSLQGLLFGICIPC